jgi:hypothetical protein
MGRRFLQIKEIFRYDSQKNLRPYACLHYTNVVEPLSDFQIVPVDTVIEHLTRKLRMFKIMTIH